MGSYRCPSLTLIPTSSSSIPSYLSPHYSHKDWCPAAPSCTQCYHTCIRHLKTALPLSSCHLSSLLSFPPFYKGYSSLHLITLLTSKFSTAFSLSFLFLFFSNPDQSVQFRLYQITSNLMHIMLTILPPFFLPLFPPSFLPLFPHSLPPSLPSIRPSIHPFSLPSFPYLLHPINYTTSCTTIHYLYL